MQKVQSADGTAIAYDQLGSGPPVILVAGAFSFRKFPKNVQIAEMLSDEFTVINFDRRGRGDSGDTQPYAVEREFEDIQALIDAVGGSAYVWGMSSGAALSLRAAAAGLNITKLALYQPPFIVDPSDPTPPPDFAAKLDELVAADQRSQAVKYFMTKGMGAPGFVVGIMRLLPLWKRLTAVAHTLPYDFAIMGDTVTGKPLNADDWAPVKCPTVVMDGEKAPARSRKGSQAIAEVLPNATYQFVKGQGIDVSPAVLVPMLKDFFKS